MAGAAAGAPNAGWAPNAPVLPRAGAGADAAAAPPKAPVAPPKLKAGAAAAGAAAGAPKAGAEVAPVGMAGTAAVSALRPRDRARLDVGDAVDLYRTAAYRRAPPRS
jgi:hypothetical protein